MVWFCVFGSSGELVGEGGGLKIREERRRIRDDKITPDDTGQTPNSSARLVTSRPDRLYSAITRHPPATSSQFQSRRHLQQGRQTEKSGKRGKRRFREWGRCQGVRGGRGGGQVVSA